MNNAHLPMLNEIVNLFVQKIRRERFIELLSKPKRYNNGLSDLLHDPRYFDDKVINKIPDDEQEVESIYVRLIRLGFKKQCFIFSSNYELDGKWLDTLEALKAICYNTDSMLFCPTSKIGYYEGHEGWRYILKTS